MESISYTGHELFQGDGSELWTWRADYISKLAIRHNVPKTIT